MCSGQQLETDNRQELGSLRLHYDNNNLHCHYKKLKLRIVKSEES